MVPMTVPSLSLVTFLEKIVKAAICKIAMAVGFMSVDAIIYIPGIVQGKVS